MKKSMMLTFAGLIFAATPLFAAEMQVSKEDREKLADMHTKMAACLKSDKPLSECRKDMMKTCKEIKDGCPMMHHMKGMMKGEGMMDEGQKSKD